MGGAGADFALALLGRAGSAACAERSPPAGGVPPAGEVSPEGRSGVRRRGGGGGGGGRRLHVGRCLRGGGRRIRPLTAPAVTVRRRSRARHQPAPSRVAVGVVRRPQQVARLGDVPHHVALVVGEVTGGDDVHAQLVQVDGMPLAEPEAAGSAFRRGDGEVDVQLALEAGQQRLDAVYAGSAHHFPDEQNAHRLQHSRAGAPGLPEVCCWTGSGGEEYRRQQKHRRQPLARLSCFAHCRDSARP